MLLGRVSTCAVTAIAVALIGICTPASAGQPIVLSIIDNGGDLASTGVIIENYKKANPDKVKEIKIQRGPAPETPAKIKAQQDAAAREAAEAEAKRAAPVKTRKD